MRPVSYRAESVLSAGVPGNPKDPCAQRVYTLALKQSL